MEKLSGDWLIAVRDGFFGRLYYANHNLKKKSSNENEIKFVIKSYRYETRK